MTNISQQKNCSKLSKETNRESYKIDGEDTERKTKRETAREKIQRQ